MSKVFETAKAAILSGKVDKTIVISLRKMFNTYERSSNGYSTSVTAFVPTTEQVNELSELLADNHPLVVGALHETGMAIVQNKRHRRAFESVADIAADCREFALVGFDGLESSLPNYHPVYRARDSKGRSFPFKVVPWQSGGKGPELVSPNYY